MQKKLSLVGLIGYQDSAFLLCTPYIADTTSWYIEWVQYCLKWTSTVLVNLKYFVWLENTMLLPLQ